MTDAQTEARAIARWAVLGCGVPATLDKVDPIAEAIATALAAKDAELAAANDAWRAMKDRAHAAEAQLAERAGGVNEDALRALAQAYDREDAAQRGEPDPWNLDDPGDIGDSDTWVSERLACARVAAEAFLSALEPAAPEGRREPAGWSDEDMARHWIDRYAAGVDASPQMGRILSCVSLARPSEQAVTEAMVEAAIAAMFHGHGWFPPPYAMRAALKAAMEAGHD